MEASELIQFLNGETEVAIFASNIGEEVNRFVASLATKGGSAPVSLSGEISGFVLRREHIVHLCEACIQQLIGLQHLQYVIDVLDLSEVQFSDDCVRDAVSDLANGENAFINEVTVRDVRDRMRRYK